MTTPEARRAAPIVEHDSREPQRRPDWSIAASTKWRDRIRRAVGSDAAPIPPGQLWQREAARDVQAHGEPTPRIARLRRLPFGVTRRAFVAEQIERRRPAMRATRAELDALRGSRRLEPEPSSMARTGLALGLAFTTDGGAR